MDLRKEIKLSDLFGRKAKSPGADQEPKPEREPKSGTLLFGRKGKAPTTGNPPTADNPKPARERKPRKPHRNPGVRRSPSLGGGKKIVGLKIGASHLAAARVANGAAPELVQIAHMELEPGIVVGGELREPDALSEALKIFFRKNKLPRQGVRLGIASNRIGVRTFDVAGVEDEKQLHNAVRFRAQEALPIPLEEAVLDYHVLSDFVNEEGVRVRRVLLVVAYRELVDRYVAACRKAGIRLAGIDLEGFAALRALSGDTGGPSNAALVVASVGHDRSTLAVSNGTFCEFTRVIEWGGSALTDALARGLEVEPPVAEMLKHQLSLDGDEVPEGFTEEHVARAREALREGLQAFARELVSSLQFYQGQPNSLGIREVVVAGGTAQLGGLAAELQRLVGVSVRVGDPFDTVAVGKKVEVAGNPALAVPIGLGMAL
jgi:type IV pilus assembly protein PilM